MTLLRKEWEPPSPASLHGAPDALMSTTLHPGQPAVGPAHQPPGPPLSRPLPCILSCFFQGQHTSLQAPRSHVHCPAS